MLGSSLRATFRSGQVDHSRHQSINAETAKVAENAEDIGSSLVRQDSMDENIARPAGIARRRFAADAVGRTRRKATDPPKSPRAHFCAFVGPRGSAGVAGRRAMRTPLSVALRSLRPLRSRSDAAITRTARERP